MLDPMIWECTECHALLAAATYKKKGRYVLSRPCICCPKGRMVHPTMTVADRVVPRRPLYDQDDELPKQGTLF